MDFNELFTIIKILKFLKCSNNLIFVAKCAGQVLLKSGASRNLNPLQLLLIMLVILSLELTVFLLNFHLTSGVLHTP